MTGKTGDRPQYVHAPVFFYGGFMERSPIIIRRKQADINVNALRQVTEILRTVNYGSIALIVQGGRVLQINKIENCKLVASDSDREHNNTKEQRG